MLTSIIVPTWNGTRWLADCLRALEQECTAADEIIVIDNGSTDGTPDNVAREFPRVHLVRLDRNYGFAGGVNRGLQLARGDILVLVNQDVIVQEGCLSQLRARLCASGPAIAGCKLYYPDGRTIQHAGGILRMPRAEPDHYGYRQIDDGRWNMVTEVDYVTGAVFAFDRAVLQAIGLFDEDFFPAYYEEGDYCFRARAAGFPIIYEPGAVAIHHETQSTDPHSAAYFQAMQHGRLRFVLKHCTAAQFCDEFVPAELQWLSEVRSRGHRGLLLHAYLHAMLAVPLLYAVRSPADHGESAARVLNGLAALSYQALAPAE